MKEKRIMSITKRVIIGRDHRIRLEIDVPADIPEGEAEAVVEIKPLKGDDVRDRLAVHPGLSKIAMSYDPTEPMSREEWPDGDS
jgi:hypothetical protein